MPEIFDGMMDEWLPKVVATYADKVAADERFPDGKELISAFDKATAIYKDRRSKDDVKALTEKCNELAVAASLLDRLEQGQTLAYEPKLSASKKTLDFRIDGPEEPYLWVDVKTVAPEWVDTDAEWARFSAIRNELPENMHLVVNDAGIGGQMLKTRWSLYNRTAEIEKKVEEMTEAERKAPISVLFCSSGFAWHVDTLEDFADFYRNGKFRADDWASTMMKRYRDEKKIAFRRNLVGFHYLQRGQFEVLPKEFRLFVRGPTFLG